jgi:S-adenosylmethionine hydrolase
MKTITFTSDFGTNDWFTAAVKGEIIKIAGDVRVVDITHNIAPFDIRGAAFLLYAVYNNFPKGTIHLAVIDPGVGGQRKPIIVDSSGHYFVGPDNGLFSYIYTPESEVYVINASEATSQTFHARDIFGPTAAHLANGALPEQLGKKVLDHERFDVPRVKKQGDRYRGEIVYIDHFGNCITNVQNHAELSEICVSGHHISVKESYGDGQANELVCVKGSIGYYEIAVYRGSAREQLQARVGMSIDGVKS